MISHLNLLDEGHTQVRDTLILRSYCARTRAVIGSPHQRLSGRFVKPAAGGTIATLRQRCWSALGQKRTFAVQLGMSALCQ